ncbi:hypothetical protein, partial [Dielma fastidiosa]
MKKYKKFLLLLSLLITVPMICTTTIFALDTNRNFVMELETTDGKKDLLQMALGEIDDEVFYFRKVTVTVEKKQQIKLQIHLPATDNEDLKFYGGSIRTEYNASELTVSYEFGTDEYFTMKKMNDTITGIFDAVPDNPYQDALSLNVEANGGTRTTTEINVGSIILEPNYDLLDTDEKGNKVLYFSLSNNVQGKDGEMGSDKDDIGNSAGFIVEMHFTEPTTTQLQAPTLT